MDWTQVLAILGGNAGLLMGCFGMFLWATKQARTDYLHLDKKIDDSRRETNQIVKAIQDEIKDFHNRLISIQEKKVGK